MTLLCFVLDLRTIPPPLLRDLKKCLLQLANLYAVSSCGRGEGERCTKEAINSSLPDRIGLCYIHNPRSLSSSPSELKIAYRPGGSFSLHDFHHALNNLPMDCFLPELSDSVPVESGNQEVSLTKLFRNEVIYTWGAEDILKKVIVISTSVFKNTKALRQSLMDAAERCVTVEFIVLEQDGLDPYSVASEQLKRFINSLHELENCVLHRFLPDASVLCGLVKRWLQELRNDLEEPLQAIFLFKCSILGSVNQISCNLFASSSQIIDGFTSCQTCRCHGQPVSSIVNNKTRKFSCPVTCRDLGECDVIQNAVRVGEHCVLFLPSFEGSPRLRRISAPIMFNVIERTNLASLDECVIIGTSYVVTPSLCHEMDTASDECDKSELNTQLFHGLCGALFHMDQGLVCSSTCNTETMKDGAFQCFYILQPSDRGPLLLRRLAGSEEILPIPDIGRSNDLVIPVEMANSIQNSLSKVELRDYNPLQHERGLHSKLNWLVKESLQLGSTSLKSDTSPKQCNPPHRQASSLQQPSPRPAVEEEMLPNQKKDENTSSCITEEWEQLLVVDDMADSFSPSSISVSNIKKPSTTTAQAKPLDEKTSKILERLEAPRQQKQRVVSPSVGISGQMKKPLLPFDSSSSQPLKPNFQRQKRKQR